MKKTFYNHFIICACAMMALSSCNNSNSSIDDEPKMPLEQPAKYSIQLSPSQQKVLTQGNDFAFDVLKAINDEKDNVFVSPFSLGQTLGILANGAEGQTFDEIAAVLKIGDGMSLDDINSYYSTMNSALTSINSSAKFMVANSLWLNKKYVILDSYKTDMRNVFGAKVETLDFSDSKTVDVINGWVKESTNGYIPSILEKVDPELDCAWLLNSAFFKGNWTYFPKKNTYSDNFRNLLGNDENVKMMKTDETGVNGMVSDKEQALELTYSGAAFQMMIIMPRQEEINSYIKAFNGEKYAQILSQMSDRQSEVILPKFSSACQNDFIKALKVMGLNRVLTPFVAELGKITPTDGAYLSQMLQNTAIDVQEVGTVATATTAGSVGIYTSPGTPDAAQIIQYKIDRPFIYLIKERTTGAILFVGKVQSMAGMQ